MGDVGYNTKQRELVLRCVEESAGHVTALEIVRTLEDLETPVGIATVYRQLDKLVRMGLVRKFTSGDRACYQIADDGCDEHFHLKCMDCGELIHMDCDFIDEMDEHIKNHHGFVVDSSRTVLYGSCERCFKDSYGKKKDV